MFRAGSKNQLQLVSLLFLSPRLVLTSEAQQRVLKYVKGAFGETDVPDSLPEFISQRRRWLNGSFFAATYAIAHVGQVLRSGHSMTRKIVLMVETVYNIINLVFAWFSIVSNSGFLLPLANLEPQIIGEFLPFLRKPSL